MKAYNGFKQFINNDATKTKNNTIEFMNCEKSVNNNNLINLNINNLGKIETTEKKS
jgi:hypothetical protein